MEAYACPSPAPPLPGWSSSASRTGMSCVREHDHRPSAGVTDPGVVVGPQHRRGGTQWALLREGAVWPWGKLHHEATQTRGKGWLRSGEPSGEPHPSTEWGPTCRRAEGEPALRCREKGALRREPRPGARREGQPGTGVR